MDLEAILALFITSLLPYYIPIPVYLYIPHCQVVTNDLHTGNIHLIKVLVVIKGASLNHKWVASYTNIVYVYVQVNIAHLDLIHDKSLDYKTWR